MFVNNRESTVRPFTASGFTATASANDRIVPPLSPPSRGLTTIET